MDDAAEADFVSSAVDRVVNLAHPHELEHLHPIAQVMEHEHEVIVVLERLAFHPGDRFKLILGVLRIVHQFAYLVIHEAGQFDVEIRIGLGDGLEHFAQVVLIEFGEFREAVIGQQVGEFLRFAGVVLLVHGNGGTADQEGGLQPSMPAHDQP